MGWPYDGKPNRLIKVFFKSAGQGSDLSVFGGNSPVVPAAFSGAIYTTTWTRKRSGFRGAVSDATSWPAM